MLIIGAGGFSKEVLELVHRQCGQKEICFYDDSGTSMEAGLIYEKFRIITNLSEAANYFQLLDDRFVLGVGDPVLRRKLYEKFKNTRGIAYSLISEDAYIGSFGNEI